MKKIKIIGVFISMLLAIVFHFGYDLFPSYFTSIISPVNESVWEHMKLIVTSSIVFGLLEYLWYKNKKINVNNFILSYGVSTVIGIIIYLLVYIPLDDFFGYKSYIAIGLLFLIFILVQIVSYYIMSHNRISGSTVLGTFLIITTYLIFICLTYKPPEINLFYDYLNRGYGIIN